MINDDELLKLLLPEPLIDYFEIVKFEEEKKARRRLDSVPRKPFTKTFSG